MITAKRKARKNQLARERRQKDPERYNRWLRTFYGKVKRECFDAYGEGRCAICGESEIAFLALCFPNRDRKLLTARINRCGGGIYYKLKLEGFPKDQPIEVRCLNCNAKQLAYEHPREKCLRAYGGDPPRCACCGLREKALLTLDHVNGGGSKHRKQIRVRGTSFYKRLVNQGYPQDPPLRVMCWNCNRAAWTNGGTCPHKAPPP
jgi:hypothetical protein